MKKTAKICLALLLTVACLSQATLSVFAAKRTVEYVSEVIISYGNTPQEAKKWLTDNGYRYVDCDLNEGADDTIFLSKERAVYLGYKTTTNPDEAITDMKLMNMSGGYSVQDYQMILAEKKADIQQFIQQFIAALSEFRTNYQAGSPRAEAAYRMLNLMKEDDTGLLMGDLLLSKIKEEYSTEEFAELSPEEQKQHADMTTVLMQGNAELVLYIEQILATATDTDSTLWLDRLADAPDYDTMLEAVMKEDGVDPAKAEKTLAIRYDEDAKLIGGMAESYRSWLSEYADAPVKLTDGQDKIFGYLSALSTEAKEMWYAKGAQYELLNGITYDEDYTLLDLFINEDLDIAGEDVYLLYPIVSVLSDGQRAVLDFINGYQLFAMGLNTDDVMADTAAISAYAADEAGTVSVYAGIDRSVFSDEVALTGEAYRLQTSSDKDYSTNWFDDGLSDTTKVWGIVTLSVTTVTLSAWVTHAVLSSKAKAAAANVKFINDEFINASDAGIMSKKLHQSFKDAYEEALVVSDNYSTWSKVFTYVGIGFTVASILLSAYTLWCAYDDLQAYYHADFTPIPLWMVDQGVDENDAKIFTYYKAVKCNRVECNFVADNNKLLKDYGDVNGDVGKQWLALYTTTDKNAGDPIVAAFIAQVGEATVPGKYIALSLFGSEAAQNLTDAKANFTYNDAQGGIYLFYDAVFDPYAGSAVTAGVWAAVAGGTVAVAVVALLLIRRKKKGSSRKVGDRKSI